MGSQGSSSPTGNISRRPRSTARCWAVIWLALGCGLVLSVTGRTGRLRTAATAAFALLSMVVLPMGLRGEVMFRGVAAMVAAADAVAC